MWCWVKQARYKREYISYVLFTKDANQVKVFYAVWSQDSGYFGVVPFQKEAWGASEDVCACSVAQSCPTRYPVNCSPPGSSVHGISQARIPEWLAISFSTGFSYSRGQTWVFSIGRWTLYHCHTWEAFFWGYWSFNGSSPIFYFDKILTIFSSLALN